MNIISTKTIFILFAVVMLVACQFSYEKRVYGEGRLVSVSVDEFARTLTDSTVQLVDVRTAEEYAGGAIPGSVNIDVNSGHFGTCADSLLDKEHKVAIYCRSGRRSKKAAEILNMMGFNVVELDKGYNAWVESENEKSK